MIRVQLLCHPAWNRLVPVGIATFRYLMVCHSVLCQNTGGEKAILTFVKITLVFLSISNGIFGVLGSIGITGHSFEYLRCMGRQEVFRSKVKTQIQQLLPNLFVEQIQPGGFLGTPWPNRGGVQRAAVESREDSDELL